MTVAELSEWLRKTGLELKVGWHSRNNLPGEWEVKLKKEAPFSNGYTNYQYGQDLAETIARAMEYYESRYYR